jgi:hypothetical protein
MRGWTCMVEGWRIETDGTESGSISARLLIDASGRKGCLPIPRVPYFPATLALWADVETRDYSATRVEAIPHGWLWAAPITERRLSLMFFCDPAHLRRRSKGVNLERFLWEQLANTALFSGFVQAPFIRGVAVCDATCAYTTADRGRLPENRRIKLQPRPALFDRSRESTAERARRRSCDANGSALSRARASLCARFHKDRQQEAVASHSRGRVGITARWNVTLIRRSGPRDVPYRFQFLLRALPIHLSRRSPPLPCDWHRRSRSHKNLALSAEKSTRGPDPARHRLNARLSF